MNVSISISIENLSILTEMMISNQIPFSMSFQSNGDPIVKSINTKEVEKKEGIEDVNYAKNRDSEIIELIYQKFIERRLEQSRPKLNEIAKELSISLPTFKNKFQKHYGKSFYQVYLDKKMEHAATLLKKGYSASYISNRIGYSHPIKFSKMFQKHYGITPKKFQMQHSTKYEH